jgi:hypothetical protein
MAVPIYPFDGLTHFCQRSPPPLWEALLGLYSAKTQRDYNAQVPHSQTYHHPRHEICKGLPSGHKPCLQLQHLKVCWGLSLPSLLLQSPCCLKLHYQNPADLPQEQGHWPLHLVFFHLLNVQFSQEVQPSLGKGSDSCGRTEDSFHLCLFFCGLHLIGGFFHSFKRFLTKVLQHCQYFR